MRIFNTLLLASLLASCGSAPETNLVAPLPGPTTVTGKAELILPVAFSLDDFDWQHQSLSFQLYNKDRYPVERVQTLQAGDLFVFDGDTMTVEQIEFDGDEVFINKGLEEGGATLCLEDNGHYRGFLWDDHATYTALDRVTLPLAPEWKLIDSGENPSDPNTELTQGQQGYLTSLPAYRENFSPLDTEIRVQNGQITAIHRRWIP